VKPPDLGTRPGNPGYRDLGLVRSVFLTKATYAIAEAKKPTPAKKVLARSWVVINMGKWRAVWLKAVPRTKMLADK
jgi:hypothetical protein